MVSKWDNVHHCIYSVVLTEHPPCSRKCTRHWGYRQDNTVHTIWYFPASLAVKSGHMIEVQPMERGQKWRATLPRVAYKGFSTILHSLLSCVCQQMQKVQNRTQRSCRSHKIGKTIKCMETNSLTTKQRPLLGHYNWETACYSYNISWLMHWVSHYAHHFLRRLSHPRKKDGPPREFLNFLLLHPLLVYVSLPLLSSSASPRRQIHQYRGLIPFPHLFCTYILLTVCLPQKIHLTLLSP